MDLVTLEVLRPHIALVSIQRPQARNAINAEVAKQLAKIVRGVESDPDIWVAVLTGAGGKAFCAGADLGEVAEGGMEALFTSDGAFAGFVKYPRQKVWIAAVEGFAVAGGCEIALSCDMIVASEQSVFSLPEVKRGLIAAAGGAYRLVRALPRSIAIELIATGGDLRAPRAFELGLINRITAEGRAVEEALALASCICANAPIAVRESLQLARQAFDLDDDSLFALGLSAHERIMLTRDFAEGPRAFLEKRSPVWEGR